MANNAVSVTKDVLNEIEALRTELEQVKSERDVYKARADDHYDSAMKMARKADEHRMEFPFHRVSALASSWRRLFSFSPCYFPFIKLGLPTARARMR